MDNGSHRRRLKVVTSTHKFATLRSEPGYNVCSHRSTKYLRCYHCHAYGLKVKLFEEQLIKLRTKTQFNQSSQIEPDSTSLVEREKPSEP